MAITILLKFDIAIVIAIVIAIAIAIAIAIEICSSNFQLNFTTSIQPFHNHSRLYNYKAVIRKSNI